MSRATTAIPIIFGCMAFGREGSPLARVHDLSVCHDILSTFKAYGHSRLDTARVYGGGSSETYLKELDAVKNGFSVATKAFPTVKTAPGLPIYTHGAADITRSINDSLAALGVQSVDLFYLHSPDRETPFEETLEAVNANYLAGKFKRFGLSNYRADEVEQIVLLCRARGWVVPDVYQGIFNAITRTAEPELFPVLRKYGISFYAYSPLAGGFFTGGYKKGEAASANGRFDPSRREGQSHRSRYWKDEYFEALELVGNVAEKRGLSLAEIGLRWCMHHSSLKREHGDAVIIGASSVEQLARNLTDLEKGRLDGEVLEALESAWRAVKVVAPKYHA